MRHYALFLALIFAFSMPFLAHGLQEEEFLEKSDLRGKLTVEKDENGIVKSVTIEGLNRTVKIVTLRFIARGSTRKIEQADLDRLAKFEGKTVHVFLRSYSGKVVNVSTPTIIKGEANDGLSKD